MPRALQTSGIAISVICRRGHALSCFGASMCLHTTEVATTLATAVSKWIFSVLNSEIQVSFFRKLPLQNLVFLKFYSLNEEAVRSKIRIDKIYFILFMFIYFHSINKSLRTIKEIFATFEKTLSVYI